MHIYRHGKLVGQVKSIGLWVNQGQKNVLY